MMPLRNHLDGYEFDSGVGDEGLSEVHDWMESDLCCMELDCTDAFVSDDSHPGDAILGRT